MKLCEAIRHLPGEEGEIMVPQYWPGYNCQELARIVRAPERTVKYRLSVAREYPQRELGESDAMCLNDQPGAMRQWVWLPPEQEAVLERRFARATSPTRLAKAPSGDPAPPTTAKGAGIIDIRLAQKVTLAFKATALSDLCDRLRADTGIPITAGPSVADEKVTLFCEKLPLRDVMRQLSRPFGYTWVRSQKEGEYRYELVQDLRSQLLEEALRNQDRNAALLALERGIERFRPYLDLSPDEALAKARNAPPEEKKLLAQYAKYSWGLAQMYFRLSPQELAALRAGQTLLFSPAPEPGQQLLPPALARGVLESQRDHRLLKRDKGFDWGNAAGLPEGLPLTAIPEAQPVITLIIGQTDMGQFTLAGGVGFAIGTSPAQPLAGWQEAVASFAFGGDTMFIVGNPADGYMILSENLATGASAALPGLKNEIANARLARDPALQLHVTVQPRRSDGPILSAQSGGAPPVPGQGEEAGKQTEPKVTTADVLEALHHATGMPIVADFYTRLYLPEMVSVKDRPLFEALNQLSDAMHLRWHKDASPRAAGYPRSGWTWLQFRSASFYYDRLKEVPNRLLARWSASRRKNGALPLDDLLEIAQLSDAQLDAADMAEGARECWGLAEWNLARTKHLRAHMRYLAEFTPEQRLAAMRPAGLAFTRMSLSQQQQFLSLTLGAQAYRVKIDLADLGTAALHAEYMAMGDRQWVAPEEPGQALHLAPRPPLSDQEREKALQSARRFTPNESEEKILARRRPEPDLQLVYTIGTPESRQIRRRVTITGDGYHLPD